jgi:hypothetical protein
MKCLSRCRTRIACSGSCRQASGQYWDPGIFHKSGDHVLPAGLGVVYPWGLIAGFPYKGVPRGQYPHERCRNAKVRFMFSGGYFFRGSASFFDMTKVLICLKVM